MRKILLATLLGMMMACSNSPYAGLSGQFPVIDQFPHEFRFSEKNLPDLIETDLIEGRVRPMGKIKIDDQTEMLISNNYHGDTPPWGDIIGYIFRDDQQVKEITLASDFSESYIWSTLDQDLTLKVYSSSLNEAGEEETSESTLDLKTQ